ncbi:MAG: sporulation transcriptional regulator SpoIIID [Oscillospiraceae bacterium]|nr:sporulation transcriptional regulator SpoIIID [Oscillospiraceae bacterium]
MINTDSELKDRSVILAEYIIETGSTVRAAAKQFGISKSTVHKDLTEKLQTVCPSLYPAVKKVLETNKKERHIRGGMATKHKYEEKALQKNISDVKKNAKNSH